MIYSTFKGPSHSYIIYYCRTDIDEARVISFLWVRIDTMSESSQGNVLAHKKKSVQN